MACPYDPGMEDDHPLRELLNAEFCFWSGLPPCPKCGGDHGDPACAPEVDAEYRSVFHGTPCSSCGAGTTRADHEAECKIAYARPLAGWVRRIGKKGHREWFHETTGVTVRDVRESPHPERFAVISPFPSGRRVTTAHAPTFPLAMAFAEEDVKIVEAKWAPIRPIPTNGGD